MNLRQIEAFVKIAEYESFSEAARSLYVTQPTVSSNISLLEKEMNTHLFIRNKKRILLTEKGAEFYTYAKRMTLLIEEMENQFLANQETADSFHLTIAASSVPSQYLLPEILYHFKQKYPHGQITLKETDSSEVANMIMNRQADIGFSGSKAHTKSCKFVPFYKDELVLITPNEKRFQKIQHVSSLAELVQHEAVILREKGSGTRNETIKILEKMGIHKETLNIAANIENTEIIKQSVSRGIGISLLSYLAVKDEIADKKILVFPLENGMGSRDIFFVYNRQFALTPAAKKFANIVKMLYPRCKV